MAQPNLKDIFPFTDTSEEEFLLINDEVSNENWNVSDNYMKCDINFKIFQYTEHKDNDYEAAIDPDNNFYDNAGNDCQYYTADKLNGTVNYKTGFSIMHFNCRSLPQNFERIKESLIEINNNFDIVALTETWLNENNKDDYVLDGYEVCHIVRKNRKGGGVAVYIKNGINYKVIEEFCINKDNCFECVTVDLCGVMKKNIRISVMYRQPGSNIDECTETVNNIFSNISNSKTCYLCGDLNIGLLNHDKHRKTKEFIDALYSLSMYPLIDRPSRITEYSATLIDNIFTNDLITDKLSGLIINDVSDHLPVFSIIKNNFNKSHGEKKYFKMNNILNFENFKTELNNLDWNIIYEKNDVNLAYDCFIETIKNIYDRNCTCKKVYFTKKKNYKPWITKGLQNACKKKNNLYRRFIRCRSKDAEMKYKIYKNKLTNILRYCEREYYNKTLELHKKDIKRTWKILNEVINMRCKSNSFSTNFIEDGIEITNKQEIAEGFNNFFVNIGPELARNIVPPCNHCHH